MCFPDFGCLSGAVPSGLLKFVTLCHTMSLQLVVFQRVAHGGCACVGGILGCVGGEVRRRRAGCA